MKQAESVLIKKITKAAATDATDSLAVEEPLEIQLAYSTVTGKMQKNIAVTMRTPCNDSDLAAGFLFTEGIIKQKEDILDTRHIAADENRILITLKQNVLPALNNAERNFYSTSSCGICGKASIDAIHTLSVYQQAEDNIKISASLLFGLQAAMKNHQEVFKDTGGIHASALFSNKAEFIMLREDIGRHNALDKLIGYFFLQGLLPLKDHILFLSGRAGFELIQKSAMAGIRLIVAVGAPSSLAVELAKETGITLIGFLREDRFNIYSGEQRIVL